MIATALLGLLALSGCNRHEAADYFPLAPGARRVMRVYTRTIAGKDTTDTTEVRIVEVVRGEQELPPLGKVWVVETPRDSGRPTYTYFRKHEDGVVQVLPMPDKKPPVELLYLSLPLAKGLKWYDTKSRREMMEVVAQESVAVEAGRFPDCFEVVVRSTKSDWVMSQWFAPNVGAVKWENHATWTGKDGVRRDLYRRAELIAYQLPDKAAGPR
jgi:hypothetical protein